MFHICMFQQLLHLSMGTLDADGKYYIQDTHMYSKAIAPHCCLYLRNCALLPGPMILNVCLAHY